MPSPRGNVTASRVRVCTSRFSRCLEAYKLRPSRRAGKPAWHGTDAKGEGAPPMKILYFNDFRLGVLKGDSSVVDVTAIVQDIPHTGPGDLINGLIERFSSYRQKLEQALAQGHGVPLATRPLPPPFPNPTTLPSAALPSLSPP